jgi:polysaccharide biosynthesis protein PslG
MSCSEAGRASRLLALALSAGLLLAWASTGDAQQLRGVALHPMASDDSASTIEREFDLLQAAGADSVRFDIFWTAVEWSGKGQYDAKALAWLDWVLAQAQSHGLKVILDIWSTPCWASSAPVTMTLGCTYGWWSRPVRYYPPKNAQDYADFAAFAAKRWAPELAAVELWNEPNGNFFYSQDKAGDYARLVRAAYPAIKAVAPNLPVLISMAGTDSSFLSELYADGVRGYYDGIAVHPYDQPALAGLIALRAYELSQADTAPIWVTEVGWSSATVGLGAQADDVTSVLRQLAALPYVSATELYELRDEAFNPLAPADNFGLIFDNFYPKPAWYAFVSSLASSEGT